MHINETVGYALILVYPGIKPYYSMTEHIMVQFTPLTVAEPLAAVWSLGGAGSAGVTRHVRVLVGDRAGGREIRYLVRDLNCDLTVLIRNRWQSSIFYLLLVLFIV